MAGAHASSNSISHADGPRPVNLRNDLGPLADLIEVAFATSMDSGGRAAVREMRALARMGPGLSILNSLNSLAQGMGQGYVWVQDGRLVGNVSVYPADGPGYDGRTWVIVNVAVHPDYRRRGIARELMQTSLDMIQQRGGQSAILQVDSDNPDARRLYIRLGFREERNWIVWKRNGTYTMPPPYPRAARQIHITRRARGEWQAEWDLASRVRPESQGGLGWLHPLHESYFRRGLWKQFQEWINLRSREHLVIRSADEQKILASLWVGQSVMSNTVDLTLMVDPDYEGVYDEALINLATRRFGSHTLSLEHPGDRDVTSAILRRYQFLARRDVVHMRWDASRSTV